MTHETDMKDIRKELKQYLDKFIKALSSLPAFFPAHTSFSGMHQPLYVRPYQPPSISPPEYLPLLTEAEAAEHAFDEQWIAQSPWWSEEEGGASRQPVLPWATMHHLIKRAIILGHSGCGKSWLLKDEGLYVARMQQASLEAQESLDDFILPIYLSLPAFSAILHEMPDNDVNKAITLLMQHSYGLSDAFCLWMCHWLAQHTVLFLGDELDRVERHQQETLADHLQQLAGNTRCRILLTSRIRGYPGCPISLSHNRQEQELEILPVSRLQTRACISSWFEGRPAQARSLSSWMSTHPLWDIRVRNMHTLSLLCYLHERVDALPVQQARFFKLLLQNLMDELLGQHAATEGYQGVLLTVLERIAWYLMQREQTTIDLVQLRQIVNEICAERQEQLVPEEAFSPARIVHDVTWLLCQLAAECEPGIPLAYSLDESWQHYLVAHYLMDANGTVYQERLTQAQRQLSAWRSTLPYLIALVNDVSSVIVWLVEQSEADFQTTILEGYSLAEAQWQSLRPAVVKPIFDRLLSPPLHAPLMLKSLAVAIAIQLAGSGFFDNLQNMLWDAQSTMAQRCVSAWVAGRLGVVSLRDDLALALWEDEHDVYGALSDVVYLRSAAALALGGLGEREITDELVQAWEETSAIPVRCAVSWAVGQLQDERGIEKLTSGLQNQSLAVQVSVIWALGNIGNSTYVNMLLPLLGDTPVGWSVFEALARIGEVAAPVLLSLLIDQQTRPDKRWMALLLLRLIGQYDKVVEVSERLLTDPDRELRKAAVETLAYLHAVEAVPALLQRIHDENEDLQVQLAVGHALYRLQQGMNQVVLSELETLLSDGRQPERVRAAAAMTLGTLREKRVKKVLLQALKDEKAMVRREAGLALSLLSERGEDEIAEQLVALLMDNDIQVRRAALNGLERTSTSHLLPQLKSALSQLKEKDIYLGIGIAKLMAQLGDHEGVRFLRQILLAQKVSMSTCSQAINALGALVSIEARDILWQLAQSRSDRVSWEAVKVLSSKGDVRILEPLLKQLRRGDLRQRQEAATLLGTIADERAIAEMCAALQEPDIPLVVAVVRSLGQIQHSEALMALRQALASNHSVIRREAAIELGKRGDFQAVEVLLETLRDVKEETVRRCAAIQLLCQSGVPEAMTELLAALWDTDQQVRACAAKGLLEVHIGCCLRMAASHLTLA